MHKKTSPAIFFCRTDRLRDWYIGDRRKNITLGLLPDGHQMLSRSTCSQFLDSDNFPRRELHAKFTEINRLFRIKFISMLEYFYLTRNDGKVIWFTNKNIANKNFYFDGYWLPKSIPDVIIYAHTQT